MSVNVLYRTAARATGGRDGHGGLLTEARPTGGLFVWRSGRRRLAASAGAATRGG